MTPVSSLVRQFRILRTASRIGSVKWAKCLHLCDRSYLSVTTKKDGRLSLPKLGVVIESGHAYLLSSYQLLCDLKEIGFDLMILEEGRIRLESSTLKVELNCEEEIFILWELFVRRSYDTSQLQGGIIIDVGMNIGLASLYFALMNPSCSIEAFEPFLPTYERAEYLFSLNPDLSHRIKRHNFGLWTANETRLVDYNFENKGSVGIEGLRDEIREKSRTVASESIVLKDCVEVISDVIGKSQRGPKMLKMDCEGSEYGIVDKLSEHGLLGCFDVIFMEWHRQIAGQDPNVLRLSLDRAGYRTLFFGSGHDEYGMLYAFKM